MNFVKEKYVNPFTDFGFKKLFWEEPNKDLLLDFLNELIQDKGRIQEITYLKSDQLGRTQVDRGAIYDIYCKSESGERFIVELQKAKQNFFKDRSVFYSTFPIQDQAQKGAEWNFELKAIYTVGILDFIFEEDREDEAYFHHHVKLMEIKKKKVFYDKLTFIYLEMPKFNKGEDELETHFDKWLYVIKNLSYLEKRPVRLQEKVFQKLFEVAEIAKFNPEESQAYEESLKYYRDLKNVLDTREEEGMIKGIKIGEEKGRLEEKKELAKKLLQKGLSASEISKLTELPLEIIKKF